MPFPARVIALNAFDLVPTALLTATIPCYSTLPLSNLQVWRRAPTASWPSASGTQSIFGTWNGQGFSVAFCGLDRHNLSGNATVRFRGFANADGTGTVLIDSGTVAAVNIAALGSFTWGVDPLGLGIFTGYRGFQYTALWLTRATILSFQIDITDTTNSKQQIDLSRIIVGDYTELTYNADFGAAANWTEATQQEDTDGGSLLSDARLPRRSLAGSFQFLNPTERQALYDLTRYVGMRIPFTISLQSGEPASYGRDFTLLQAKFQGQLPTLTWQYANSHSAPFQIVEI